MVENALGQSKGRWRCLLKRNDCHLSNIILITSAYIVLHNFCEMFIDECLVGKKSKADKSLEKVLDAFLKNQDKAENVLKNTKNVGRRK